MLSPFGKEVRKMRIEHKDTPNLKDMAEALDVSSAYLSAVETGKKPASSALVEKIADYFNVSARQRTELHQLASKSAKFVQLQLTGANSKSRELATAFARRFPGLDEDEVDTWLQFIENHGINKK